MEKEKNGNGKTKKAKRYSAKDMVELCVICVYMVQQKGACTIFDMMEAFKKELNATVHKGTLGKALKALQKKDLIAAAQHGGERLYSIKRLKFNLNVEVPHVQNIYTELMEDPTGVAIKESIENSLNNPQGPKDRKLPELWADYVAEVEVTGALLGAQPMMGNPGLALDYEKSKYNNTIPANLDPAEEVKVFERGPGGEMKIHRGCIAGFLRNGLRSMGISEWSVKYFFVEPILIEPEDDQVTVRRLPIQRDGYHGKGGGAAGFSVHEEIRSGTKFLFRFSAPTKNFMEPKQMEFFLDKILSSSIRSLSPARGIQTGTCKLLKLEHTMWPDFGAEDKAA
jgi:hypothetical protein